MRQITKSLSNVQKLAPTAAKMTTVYKSAFHKQRYLELSVNLAFFVLVGLHISVQLS